jgi:hypothetical protein
MFFRPLDEQKGEDEQQHPTVRERCGPGTSQRPPPWRPARNPDRDSRSFSNYNFALEPRRLSFAGPGPASRVLPGSPRLESTDAPYVSSLAPRGHLQEWLMS